MPDDRGLLREVAWQEVFPWLLLLRTFRLAADVRKLALAAAAIVATALGWWVVAYLFAADVQAASTVRSPAWPWNRAALTSPAVEVSPAHLAEDALLYVPWREARHAFSANASWLSGPFRTLLSRSATITTFAAALLAALWALVVWAFFGGAITRIAAVELAVEERLSLKAALGYAARKWPAFFAGPLLPLVLLVLLSLPLAVLGAVMRMDIGVLVAGLAWPLALVAGVVMTLSLIGLALGWPLMWATIAVDGTDSFDAFGRSYSYVYQRPLNYLFYGLVSLVIGVVGWIVVSTLAALVIHLTSWGVSWGSGEERLRNVEWTASAGQPIMFEPPFASPPPQAAPLDGVGRFGATLIAFWTTCVRLLALAFGYSFFWTASTGIYLLLRRDADATEIDEIHVDEREDDSPLPPIRTDDAGVAVLADAPAAPGEDGGEAAGSDR